MKFIDKMLSEGGKVEDDDDDEDKEDKDDEFSEDLD
jgi:hypothetical protein